MSMSDARAMVTAAVYARKSTEQAGVSDEQKSVTRQLEHATAYAERKGWGVAPEFVFVDDGISGAEFAARPGFVRLMAAVTAKPAPAFQVLIMSEESRLGREAIETAYALKQIVTAGVRVFFYLEDRERTLDSPTDKIMMSLTAYADELEREKARVRTFDALLRKAKAGHVTGGRVFGYRNAPITDASGQRLRVERQIDEAEAAVVRDIYQRCARGEGIVTIAKALNAVGAPAPRAQQDRPRAWAPSSVREVLHRELYAGVIVWNKTKKRNPWGRAERSARAAEDWIRVEAPHLRIVPEDAWFAARERLEEARRVYLRGTKGQLWGRPGHGVDSKYLLTGLMRCDECGGSVYVKTRAHGRRRVAFYGCTSYHLRGTAVCSNGIEVSMESMNDLVLGAFEADILRPQIVERVVRGFIAALRPSMAERDARRAALRAERDRIEGALERLTAAITAGGELAPLLAALKAQEADRQAIRRELASLGTAERLDVRQLEADARERLTVWRELLLSDAVGPARQMLKKLLAAPLRARPVRESGVRGWEVTGRGSLGKLLSGLVAANMVASPSGIEPESRP